MQTFKITVVAVFALAGVAASFMVHQHATARSRKDFELSDQQNGQLAALIAAHAQLLGRVTGGTNITGATEELKRLRAEAEKLRQQTNELGNKLAQSRDARRLLGFPATPPGYDYTPEELALRQEMSGDREKDARILTQAFWDYYRKHQDQFPSSLDQLAPYLAENHLSLTGTNEFDLIYPGPQNGLTNFPTQTLAVIRERQPWLAPSGRQARVYGMLTIPPRVVETDDNFQSWEAEHVFLTPDPGQQ